MPAAYRVHKLLQELIVPGNTEQFLNDPESVSDRYGLNAEERRALAAGTPQSMGEIGVLPLLQMMLLFARAPEMGKGGAMSGLIAELRGDKNG